jgi:signal transduction histidine kinase
MAASSSDTLGSLLRTIDPRRSLVAGAAWLIIALTVTFSVAAAVWVGSIARESAVEQHIRRLSLETDQLGSDLGQALSARLDAVRAAGGILRATNAENRRSGLSEVFNELVSAYPQLDWIAIADADGVVTRSNGAVQNGSNVSASPWFSAGMRAPWLGVITTLHGSPLPAANAAALGDMAAPVQDDSGRIVGVIAAHLSWRRAAYHPERLTDESDPGGSTQACVLNRDGIVLVGPDRIRGKPWNGVPIDTDRASQVAGLPGAAAAAPRFERLPDGRRVLVSRAQLSAGNEITRLGWQVQLSEPYERVHRRADALVFKIVWVSLFLGAVTAFGGILGARHLTGRLKRLALSVAAVGQNESAKLEAPAGVDEVAQLGGAFARILDDLQRDRSQLKALSDELERRVAIRTREVERLAEESRYAAVVRERLQIARDLHDTLAHSMMAMLSEIRFLRRLLAHDPASVPAELARAEEIARDGLQEARTAITQMRVNAVRDTGLGPALSRAFEQFIDHTGLSGEFDADTAAARFGDERAETILRMAQEVLRNVERHAQATRVIVRLRTIDGARLELQIEDDGVGFDTQTLRPGHYGIVGLREQADLIGAEVQIDSAANRGTRVRISMPLSPIAFAQA